MIRTVLSTQSGAVRRRHPLSRWAEPQNKCLAYPPRRAFVTNTNIAAASHYRAFGVVRLESHIPSSRDQQIANLFTIRYHDLDDTVAVFPFTV